MPGFDGTGPLGTGPYGRGLGPCGRGMAAGWGRGFRRGGWYGGVGFVPPFTPGEEKGYLEQQKSWLESQLAGIEKRLQGMQDSQAEK